MTVLGRRDGGEPTGEFGHYRAPDGSRGGAVSVDLDRPHVVLVVGKRGSGKSNTLAVLAEGLAAASGVTPVVADPMNAFGTLSEMDGDGGTRVVAPRVRADALDARSWCQLLGLNVESDVGALVWQAASRESTLTEMKSFVAEADVPASTRRAASNHLQLAASWGVFGSGGTESTFEEESKVYDLAGVEREPANAVVGAVASRLYRERLDGKRGVLPWLLVDEAHAYLDGVAASALRRILTRGRQPGVSLVLATQRPDALPAVAVSQADLLVAHRLSSRADREALSAARPALVEQVGADQWPTVPGEALVLDDATDGVHRVQVRERNTPDGGESARASNQCGSKVSSTPG